MIKICISIQFINNQTKGVIMNESITKMVATKVSEVETAIRDAYRTADSNVPVMEDENLRFHFVSKEFRRKLVDVEFHYERFFLSLFVNGLERTFAIKISDLFNMKEETSIEIQFGNKLSVPPPKVERKAKVVHDRSHIHNVIHFVTINNVISRRTMVSILMKLFECSDASAHNWIAEMLKLGTLKQNVNHILTSTFKEVPGTLNLKHKKMIEDHIGTLLEDKVQLVFCAFAVPASVISYDEIKESITKKSLNALNDIFILEDGKVSLTDFGGKALCQMTPYRD